MDLGASKVGMYMGGVEGHIGKEGRYNYIIK